MYIIDLPPWTVVKKGHMLSFKEIIILIVRSVVWVTPATQIFLNATPHANCKRHRL